MRKPFIRVTAGKMWPGQMIGPRAKGPRRIVVESLDRVERCFGLAMMASDAYQWILRVQRSDLPLDVVEDGYVTSIGFMLHGEWFEGLTQAETDERMEAVRLAIVRRTDALTRDFYDIFGRTYLRYTDRQWSEEDPL